MNSPKCWGTFDETTLQEAFRARGPFYAISVTRACKDKDNYCALSGSEESCVFEVLKCLLGAQKEVAVCILEDTLGKNEADYNKLHQEFEEWNESTIVTQEDIIELRSKSLLKLKTFIELFKNIKAEERKPLLIGLPATNPPNFRRSIH